MKVLFFLGHPAHYHFFKATRHNLRARGHEALFAIKSKDILCDLLNADGVDYVNLLPEGKKNGFAGAVWALMKRQTRLAAFLARNRVDILIGGDSSIAQLGRVFRIPSVVTMEDDVDVIPLWAWMTLPFATHIVSPVSCRVGRWHGRKIEYPGFQKLTYLHPNRFRPDRSKLPPGISGGEPFFLVRLSALTAYHDAGIKGITIELLRRVVRVLKERGTVLISSEKPLDPEFEEYRVNSPVCDIHHLLAFADLLIGDSQSMAVEAAVLGTPSIRYSGFAGRIGVLEELEKTYNLTFGISADEPDRLIEKIREILELPGRQRAFRQRRERMLREKIDVTGFLTWLLAEYPESVQALRKEASTTLWQGFGMDPVRPGRA